MNDWEILDMNENSAFWNCSDIDVSSLTEANQDLAQFCADNIRLAPFFMLLNNELVTLKNELTQKRIESNKLDSLFSLVLDGLNSEATQHTKDMAIQEVLKCLDLLRSKK